jgi:polyisoprenoid-binding protein YceI
MRATALLSSLFFCALQAWAFEASIFEAGSHCVAYRVKSTVFFVKSSTVTGRNCDVSAQVLPEVGGLYHIEVNIPIRSFDSDEDERDRDVAKILKADKRPELTFKSDSYAPEKWREMFAKGEFELPGQLFIGEKSYPLKLASRYQELQDSGEIDGTGKVKFQDFDLRPPKAGGGIFASVKPDLELHFHFVSPRILGADSIRPMKTAEVKKGE